MLLTGFSHAIGPSYEYAQELHPTAFVRGNTARYRAAARDAEGDAGGGGAGIDVGGGSGALGLVCFIGVLGRGIAGTGCSVAFLKQPTPLLLPFSPGCLEEGVFSEIRMYGILGRRA